MSASRFVVYSAAQTAAAKKQDRFFGFVAVAIAVAFIVTTIVTESVAPAFFAAVEMVIGFWIIKFGP